MAGEFKDALKGVDWLRVAHRLSTLFRTVRGDSEVEADHQTERARGGSLTRSIEAVARQAVNCQAPRPCGCPMCGDDK